MGFEKRCENSKKGTRATRDSTSFVDKNMFAKSKRSTPVLTSVIDGNMGLKSKRSQAAMEFLMTYGWAILAAIIVIAVIAIYFRPGNLVQNQCILSAPFNCYAGVVSTNGITLEVKNGAGQSLKVQMVEVDGCGTYTPNPIIYPGGLLIADQSLTTFVIDCILESGDKFQGDITITYIKIGSGLALTSPGTIAGTVLGDDVGGAVCTDSDGDKYNVTALGCGIADCDDDNINVNPGATEICGDDLDNDCIGGDLVCLVQCNDLIDNDGDTFIDMDDAGCSSPSDNNENNCGNAICESGEITSCPGDCTGGSPTFHYIRAGATGTNNGSDWNNAYLALPATLIRGHTYYVADGVYLGYTFDDVESGIQKIIVKKAIDTLNGHGTETGWNGATMGSGRAEFGQIQFNNDYYEFNGSIGGGPGNWKGEIQPLGFYIFTGGKGIRTPQGNLGMTPSFIDISHVEIEGSGVSGNDLVYLLTNSTDWRFSYMYLHYAGRTFYLFRQVDNIIIERSAGVMSSLGPTLHSEAISSLDSQDNIIRFNLWEDVAGTGILVFGDGNYSLGNGVRDSDNWEIYGNIFYDTGIRDTQGRGNGAVTDWKDNNSSGHKVYNNVFYLLRGLNNGVTFKGDSHGPGSLVYNNIHYTFNDSNNDIDVGTTTHNYNVYRTTFPPAQSELNQQLISTDPFVNGANYNFSLVDPNSISSGIDLNSIPGFNPYPSDMYGNVRGADGKWDRGAIEYKGI